MWITVANISGGGLMAMISGEIVLRFSAAAAALILSVLVLLPTVLFPFMPARGADRRLARAGFSRFFLELAGLLRQREVLIAIVLFVAPAATFSLVNILGGLGNDYHASSRFVGLVGGAGVLLAGLVGCLIFPLVDRLMPVRYLYLAIGVLGAVFTAALIMLPREPWAFAVAMIGENIFQSLSITASAAIIFSTIGRDNPLAATTYSLMVSSFNVANTYMLVADGWGYEWRGVAGSCGVDACVSVLACLLMMGVLIGTARLKPSTASSCELR